MLGITALGSSRSSDGFRSLLKYCDHLLQGFASEIALGPVARRGGRGIPEEIGPFHRMLKVPFSTGFGLQEGVLGG